MRTYFELGPTPVEEDAAQMGEADDFAPQNKLETKAYMHQLMRMFPEVEFKVKTFPYEYDAYREVVIMYDDDDEAGVDLMLKVEMNLPLLWDDTARQELTAAGYRHLSGGDDNELNEEQKST